MAPLTQYAALATLLARLPAEQPAVTFTWLELARLRGTPLPVSARLPSYWTGPLAASWAWLGFRARLDRTGWTVTFSRERPVADSTHGEAPLHGKSLPLLAYLADLPTEQAAVTLPFTALAALVGPLSATARTSQSYWNTMVHSRAWHAAGWTARLNQHAQRVVFTRTVSASRE